MERRAIATPTWRKNTLVLLSFPEFFPPFWMLFLKLACLSALTLASSLSNPSIAGFGTAVGRARSDEDRGFVADSGGPTLRFDVDASSKEEEGRGGGWLTNWCLLDYVDLFQNLQCKNVHLSWHQTELAFTDTIRCFLVHALLCQSTDSTRDVNGLKQCKTTVGKVSRLMNAQSRKHFTIGSSRRVADKFVHFDYVCVSNNLQWKKMQSSLPDTKQKLHSPTH